MITNLIITAYCSCKLCCGSSATGLSANNKPPIQGVTVAASRLYPLGTHLHIQGMTNDFIIQDRLARRFDSRVDVYFNSHKDALRFSKQQRTVTIYVK